MRRPNFPLKGHVDKEMLEALVLGCLDRDVEWKGYVQGHLMGCDSCLDVYGDLVAEVTLTRDKGLEWARITDHAGRQVLAWSKLKWLRDPEGVWIDGAKKMLDGMIYIAQLFSGAQEPTPTWQPLETTNPDDRSPTGAMKSDETIKIGNILLQVVEPAKLTANGEFRLTLRTADEWAAGKTLRCLVLTHDGRYIAFDSQVTQESNETSFLANFYEIGLPIRDSIVLPSRCLQYLQAVKEIPVPLGSTLPAVVSTVAPDVVTPSPASAPASLQTRLGSISKWLAAKSPPAQQPAALSQTAHRQIALRWRLVGGAAALAVLIGGLSYIEMTSRPNYAQSETVSQQMATMEPQLRATMGDEQDWTTHGQQWNAILARVQTRAQTLETATAPELNTPFGISAGAAVTSLDWRLVHPDKHLLLSPQVRFQWEPTGGSQPCTVVVQRLPDRQVFRYRVEAGTQTTQVLPEYGSAEAAVEYAWRLEASPTGVTRPVPSAWTRFAVFDVIRYARALRFDREGKPKQGKPKP